MTASLHMLLEGAIDYAGLFPPAALGMEAAWREYLGHIEGEERWMVQRFAVTAARLPELAEVVGPDDEAELTVIGTGGGDLASFKAASARDLQMIEEFGRRFERRIFLEGYEVNTPGPRMIEATLNALGPLVERDLFLEIPLDEAMSDDLYSMAQSEMAYAKARLGGTQPGTHPSAEPVAAFIAECVDLGLSFKLTAGLHHPYPVDDPTTGDRMHGFLNVLMASALAEAESLNRAEIASILRGNEGFEFTEAMARYQGWEAPIELIEDARTLFTGFGSCSVNEPLSDLRALGLL